MDLRTLQLTELEILLEFCRVCKCLNLQYFLTAGTLLGAVRHKGFIPWDDDIDVAMSRKDYEIFVKRANSVLTSEYFFQEYRTEKRFPYYFAKIRKRGTYVSEPILRDIDMEQGIYIDILPLDFCPDSERLAQLFFKSMELVSCAILARESREFVCGYKKMRTRLAWGILRRLPNKVLFQIREWIRRGLTAGASGQRLCTVGGRHGYPKETYETRWFQDTVELEFEVHSFSAPSGWAELLSHMYGDYMTPPPQQERRGHFEREL